MIDRLDHLVLTVHSVARSCDFYVRGLGMTAQTVDGRTALLFGQQKLNLHPADGPPIRPRAHAPTPGSADFCLIADRPLEAVMVLLDERGLSVELGPVDRIGRAGPMRSINLRDPDDNLVEISAYR
ncbi:VOC family protein [Lichenifustis flavocetrariae]|uniref:VOC family protein n=1 Tax=Lichenifustis flavocetrariae TaxID=2949735 RepID=A0AA41YXU8_9HYPH|nr:VOC family protein [Lichenifustis flavocetrariae]MCW6510566.1 VOC family protein [Lichenifustis flavocetrariae]